MQGTMSCARRSIATSSALSNCWVLQPKGLHRPTVPVSTLHQACCQELGAASQLISGQCRRVSRHHVPCLAQNAVEAQPKTQQAELPSCWNRVPFEQQQGWLKAAAELQGLGIPAEQAHQVLVKAFGWGSQGYWRHSKVDEPPTADQIRAVAAYLASLNIQGEPLLKLVKTFPEVFGCSVDKQLKAAVGKLEADWKMSGDVLTRVLMRQPNVLGYDRDCEGTCFGECERCWARF